MNKEIKEILYMLKSVVDDPKSTFQANATTCYLLLDYITNLQEENEKLSVELNTCMIERNNYLSKIDKAIELLEKENYHCPMSLTVEKAYIIEVEKINNVISILRGEDNERV